MTHNPFLNTGVNDPANDGIKLSDDPRSLDEITGAEPNKKAKIIHTDENGVTTDEYGVKRDSKYQLVKGTANPRQAVKERKALKAYMTMKVQGGGDRLIDELWKMALYDPELAEEQFKDRNKDKSPPPTFRPWITPSIKMEAIKMIAAYEVGTPTQKIDKKETLEIGDNFTDVAKLLHEKKQKLKLLSGGKDEDIIDVEEIIK